LRRLPQAPISGLSAVLLEALRGCRSGSLAERRVHHPREWYRSLERAARNGQLGRQSRL